jgi:hypothetical protein
MARKTRESDAVGSRKSGEELGRPNSGGSDKVVASKPASLYRRTSNSDAKGRVVLGPQHANKMFRLSELPDGNLLLEPVVAVHEREVWFYRNSEAQAMVLEGIRQSRARETVSLGSFAHYADLDIDES